MDPAVPPATETPEPAALTVDPAVAVRQLNSLLRGEIAAAETYRMAIDKLSAAGDDAGVARLRQIQEDHGRAAQGLRARVEQLGGDASDTSGVWGTWAKTVQGAMSLLGNAASLKALKEGEEHGLADYNEALDDVDATSAELIRSDLVPAQQRHIGVLDQMIATPGTA